MDITLERHAKPSPEVLFQDVGGEVVLLVLDSERYFGLDPVGTRIWSLLEQDQSLQQVLETLCSEYEASRDILLKDLLALVSQLTDAGLVTLR